MSSLFCDKKKRKEKIEFTYNLLGYEQDSKRINNNRKMITWCAVENATSGCKADNMQIFKNNHIHFTGCVCEKASSSLFKIIQEREIDYSDKADTIVRSIVDNGMKCRVSDIAPGTGKKYVPIENWITLKDTVDLSKKVYDTENVYELRDKILQWLYEQYPLHLHITSYGGNLLHGFKMVDIMRKTPLRIYTHCIGYCASAATLPFLYGRRRYMSENSFFLIHQLRSNMWGKYEDLKVDLENNSMFMDKIKKIYTDTTDISVEKLDTLLEKDDWWDFDMCMEMGIGVLREE